MKLPLNFLESPGLILAHSDELITALDLPKDSPDAIEITRLMELGLPPIISVESLSVMTGLNPGLVWSLVEKTQKYYRIFHIPKGSTTRQIEAPRIALKFIQKWLSIHFEKSWTPIENVHGFTKGKSHLTAAKEHLQSKWIVSVDIHDFFPTTPSSEVRKALRLLGYKNEDSLNILERLCSYQRRLSQGAPTSPILSNICLHQIDTKLKQISNMHQSVFTRYADDIVFSGKDSIPVDLIESIQEHFENTPWKISERKVHKAIFPKRLKVHGLLVHGDRIRLTKGYRKRIRAYKHLLAAGKITDEDLFKVLGHITYQKHVEKVSTQ